MKKKLIWVLILVVLVIAACTAFVYRDTIIMYAVPQIPLSRALGSTLDAMGERYGDSPIPILLRAYDPDGLLSGQIALSDPATGAPKGTMGVEADLEGNRFFFHGAFSEGSGLPSMDLYLDRDIVAVTSQSLLGGGWYGLTYESFPEDLRSVALVSYLVSDETLEKWDASVTGLQAKMDQDRNLPNLPNIEIQDLKKVTLVLWAMRPSVEVRECIVDGGTLDCYRVVYELKGETAGLLLEKVFGRTSDGKEEIQLAFYLNQGNLLRIALNAPMGSCVLNLGPEPGKNPVSLNLQAGGLSLAAELNQEWSTIRFGESTYLYQWDPLTGEMRLQLPGKEEVSLILTETENGCCIQSRDLLSLTETPLLRDFACDITLTPGAEIEPPAFKNLDQWSLEDLLIFLNGIWSVIMPS